MNWTTVTGVTKAGAQLYRAPLNVEISFENSSVVVIYQEAIGDEKIPIQSEVSHYRMVDPLTSAWLNGLTGATPLHGIEAVLAQTSPQAYIDAVIASMTGG